MPWASDVSRKGYRGCRGKEGLFAGQLRPPGKRNLMLPSQQYHHEWPITGNEPVCVFLQIQTLLKIVQRKQFPRHLTGYCACVTAEVDYQIPRFGAARVPMGGERANRAAGLGRDAPFYRHGCQAMGRP